MTFIVATHVVASRQPERRPTGTLSARANYFVIEKGVLIDFSTLYNGISCIRVAKNIWLTRKFLTKTFHMVQIYKSC